MSTSLYVSSYGEGPELIDAMADAPCYAPIIVEEYNINAPHDPAVLWYCYIHEDGSVYQYMDPDNCAREARNDRDVAIHMRG